MPCCPISRSPPAFQTYRPQSGQDAAWRAAADQITARTKNVFSWQCELYTLMRQRSVCPFGTPPRYIRKTPNIKCWFWASSRSFNDSSTPPLGFSQATKCTTCAVSTKAVLSVFGWNFTWPLRKALFIPLSFPLVHLLNQWESKGEIKPLLQEAILGLCEYPKPPFPSEKKNLTENKFKNAWNTC